jgi:ribosomal 30S subunit maturation factor RimM
MNAPDTRQRMITVGRLHGAFGVRGEVKLESFTDPLRAIARTSRGSCATHAGRNAPANG